MVVRKLPDRKTSPRRRGTVHKSKSQQGGSMSQDETTETVVVTPAVSDVATAVHVYKANDGRYYTNYQAMRDANIRRNTAVLVELGLATQGEGQTLVAQALRAESGGGSRPRRRKSRPRSVKQQQRTPRRSSSRKRGLAPANNGLEADPTERVARPLKKPKSSPPPQRRRRTQSAAPALSPQQRQEVAKEYDAKDDGWLDDMENYLLKQEKLSGPNCSGVMRQVQKLASADTGITYHHWSPEVSFLPNKAVKLSDDFRQLLDMAVEFEQKHGKDLGNGWLLTHPIKKLDNFQQHCYKMLNK